MTKEEIKNIISKIEYPNLGRNLEELKLIESIDVNEKGVDITLFIQNDDAFIKISEEIEKSLNLENLNIMKKAETPKKSMNYGSTHKPNNRAAYAKKVIAVTSGKGGVGKSTVSVNIAIGLAQEGYKVGLLDADVYGPNIPRMLGVSHEKMRWSDDNKIIPSENYGIKLMSVALTTPRADTPLVWRSSVAVSALIQFLEDVAWGELDFLVIDMPPGTGDVQLTMAQELPISGAVLVTTPQMVATDDVSRAIMMFKDIGVNISGLVENMSFFIAPDTKKEYDIFGKGGGRKIAQNYNIPFLGEIPLDIDIREKSDNGEPIVARGQDFQKVYYKNIVKNLV